MPERPTPRSADETHSLARGAGVPLDGTDWLAEFDQPAPGGRNTGDDRPAGITACPRMETSWAPATPHRFRPRRFPPHLADPDRATGTGRTPGSNSSPPHTASTVRAASTRQPAASMPSPQPCRAPRWRARARPNRCRPRSWFSPRRTNWPTQPATDPPKATPDVATTTSTRPGWMRKPPVGGASGTTRRSPGPPPSPSGPPPAAAPIVPPDCDAPGARPDLPSRRRLVTGVGLSRLRGCIRRGARPSPRMCPSSGSATPTRRSDA